MKIRKAFLDPSQPALVAAADYLLAGFTSHSAADLSNLVVVVPGGRAGRRLLEILVDRCEAAEVIFTPPQITTVGQLPELLYQAKRPFADDLVQQLAWADALRKSDRNRLLAVVAQPPADEDTARWLELGRLVQEQHRELASDGLNFADVVRRGAALDGFREEDRWRVLADIQRAYLATLDGLGLWDRQTARLFAIEHRECHSDRPIVLIAGADLNQSLRQMLDQVAQHVTALIYAPESWSERFDSHGCLIPAIWQQVVLDIPENCLVSTDDPADQADAVVRRIAQLDGRFRAEEITIGLPDERLVPQLVRQLNECQVPNRYGPGMPLSGSAVYRLLADLGSLLETKRYAEFAAIVRNPDIEAWLLNDGVRPGWVELLDEYFNDHLPTRIDGTWLGGGETSLVLSAVYERIKRLTAPLTGPARTLEQWLPAIGRVVREVYGARTFDLENAADRTAWKAGSAVQDALGELARIPAALMPVMSAAESLELLLDRLRSQQLAPAASDAAIELVGWLELPLDDAPALIVTSFNEGFVPSSINADLFLPGALRTALGLDDNARRYARDAYAVSTLLVPWRETTFLVARRNQDSDPLAPSRLLFAARPETVARRALRFFGSAKAPAARPPLAGGLTATRRDFAFDVPRPQPLDEPLARMSVTSFASYLACPYRFYLTRVVGLSSINDDATELDGAAFGSLAHQVLEQFGRREQRDSDDADTIADTLNYLLNQQVARQFGKHPGAAVLIQVEQLRLRLRALAQWQADRRAGGWRIEHAELSFSENPGPFLVDGEPMLLTGRIDRIDVHEQTGERQILDYKTSDGGDKPDQTHRKSGAWVDLQLPLYRHLARGLGIDQPVGLGFILLPKSSADVGLALAPWTDPELADADETAREVVRQVRQQQFWPPKEPPPAFSEELASICLDGVFGRKKLE